MAKNLTVAIIDDDEVYTFVTSKLIEMNNLADKVITFKDGEEGLEFLKNNKSIADDLPDFILVDINMPIMDGFQFIEAFAPLKDKLSKNITIYMVSSSVDERDIEKVKTLTQVSGYLIKPMDDKTLKSILNQE